MRYGEVWCGLVLARYGGVWHGTVWHGTVWLKSRIRQLSKVADSLIWFGKVCSGELW